MNKPPRKEKIPSQVSAHPLINTLFKRMPILRGISGNVPFEMSQRAPTPLPHSATVMVLAVVLGSSFYTHEEETVKGQVSEAPHSVVSSPIRHLHLCVNHPVREQIALYDERGNTEQ